MSLVRVLAGQIGDGTTLNTPEGEAGRVSGVMKMLGQTLEKRAPATAGDTVALGRLEQRAHRRYAIDREDRASGDPSRRALPSPVLALSIAAKERKDDVKLGQALDKLVDEDPSLIVQHNAETHEVIVWGQGEMHLRVAAERLGRSLRHRDHAAYAERRLPRNHPEADRAARTHKKQSGGHGQFGDVVLDVKPLPRGEGFTFKDEIKGGVVPGNYIPSVEEGVIDGLKHGPLGLSGRRCRGEADRRLVSLGRFIRPGVPHRRPHRHRRGAAAMHAGAARTDPDGRDRVSVRRDGEDQRHPVRAARPDSRLRHPRGLVTAGMSCAR